MNKKYIKSSYIKSSIYSFKKAVNEYNNLFEPDRLNQFFSNIFQAFNRLFIFYCCENNIEFLNEKNKTKDFNRLKNILKTKRLLTSEESYLIDYFRNIRNEFQHNINNTNDLNNSFLLVSCIVSIFKKLLKLISKSDELKSINLIGISEYKFIENDSPLSKKLKAFYSSYEFKNYEYLLASNKKIKGIPNEYIFIETIDDKNYVKATTLVSNIQNKYPKFNMNIFWRIKNVLAVVNKNFKTPKYSEIPKYKKIINSKYVLIFQNFVSYKKAFELLIINILNKNNIDDLKNFFYEKNEKKEIVDINKLIKNDHLLNL